MTRRRILTAAAAVALLGGLAGGAQAQAAGNAEAARSCQKGGWHDFVTADGKAFDSQMQCVTFGAHGGELAPKPPPSLTFMYKLPCSDQHGRRCSFDLAGTGLLPGADVVRCEPVRGCASAIAVVSADGSVAGQPRLVTECYDGFYVRTTTASGSTISSAPSKCPPPPPSSLTISFRSETCQVGADGRSCEYFVLGSGLRPGADVVSCNAAFGCTAPRVATVDSNGNVDTSVGYQACAPQFYVQSRTVEYSFISSLPTVAC